MAALVVIGNFDGVHRGHRAVLESAVAEGQRLGLDVKLLTFFPHPATVLGRKRPALLTTQERKRELVRRVSPTIELALERFDLAFAAQSPEAFGHRLVAQYGARRVVVGKNFRFGKNRAGDFDRLVEIGAELGFTARSEAMRGDERGPWSSTRVRAALAAGDLADATHVLGRPHMLSGTVVRGKQLGRTIGFPTCNLEAVEEALVPNGIYAVTVDDASSGRAVALAKGALSVGTNPTTDGDDRIKVEVYLFDIDRDLYGAKLRVHVVERLRGEEKFDDLDALVTQMRRDVEQARSVVESHCPQGDTGAYG